MEVLTETNLSKDSFGYSPRRSDKKNLTFLFLFLFSCNEEKIVNGIMMCVAAE